jgi:glutaconyl-CoA/methylmalonyl-CoA decarboxylase subunit gamma
VTVGTHRFKIEGKEYAVEVGTRIGGAVPVTVNGKTYEVELDGAPPAGAVAPPPRAAAPTPAAPAAVGGGGEVRAPIPGVVLSVDVQPGQKVVAATKVLVLEAMKMENEIYAGIDGVVTGVNVKPQQEVRQGDLLLTITAA